MRRGLEKHARAAELGNLLVGDGSLVDGHTDEVLFGCLYTLGDSGGNLVGFAEAPAYDAVAVTDYYDSGESEGAATLGNLGYTVDGNQTVLQLYVVVIRI